MLFLFVCVEIMPLFKIKKRNGRIVSFEKKKIKDAVHAAVASVGWDGSVDMNDVVEKIVQAVEEKTGDSIPDVELVQDVVESVLIASGYDAVAKQYIRYRHQRALARKDSSVMIDVENTMKEYLHQSDRRVNENANQGYSLWGLILNTSGKITANYRLSHVYPSEIGDAHRNADYHIHDLGMFSWYCAGWSLRQLLEEWFNGLENRVQSAPPKNLQSAVNQMINFLWTLQNERAGAQAFSSFDTYLAPYIHKYKKSIEDELDTVRAQFENIEAREAYVYTKTYDYVKQQMQNFVFGLNVPSRRGTQTPFTNITLDRVCPDDLRQKALLLGGIAEGDYEKKFGELEEEMKLLNRVLIEVYTQGDRNGSVFTFPIPTYNITEDFPRDDPDIDALFEMTAKYGLPYFQNFLWSQYLTTTDENGEKTKVKNPNAYTPWAVRSMCCRLQLDLKQLEKRGGGLFGSAEMTGSIGVVTLNMPRIGYCYKGDKEWFKRRVRELMDLAKMSLEIKRKEVTKRLDQGFYPYTKRYLHSFRNHFSTIGLNGMNEAILNFTEGKHDIATERGQSFTLEILDFMRAMLTQYQEETGNLYNLEATPAEGTTYRFAKEDQKQLPWIIQAGTVEAPYYTNSTQLPVGFTDDPFEALEYQDLLQGKYTWGTVLHLYMTERVTDAQRCKQLVKSVLENFALPYITITPTFSVCPKHGYLAGEHDFCPTCDKEIGYTGEKFNIDLRRKYTEDTVKLEKLSKAMSK